MKKNMPYYVPNTKEGLVNWFVKNRGWVKSRLEKLGKKQLYAMYYKERQGELCDIT